ncbi:hypothetical protein Agub_g7795 [Astrephomene gubernaculifera]|uniref:Tubulin-tyrosine ligase n=1 Tax=Astrephomene gubernaculifera TaxID=47775 RepID=A0AAD3DSK4_9CHLO|nr:hypothetical protein Agub_g7795 [Astrephomene gubernaculifera]
MALQMSPPASALPPIRPSSAAATTPTAAAAAIATASAATAATTFTQGRSPNSPPPPPPGPRTPPNPRPRSLSTTTPSKPAATNISSTTFHATAHTPSSSSSPSWPSPSSSSSPSWPLYRALVLPGNESVLLREALARRPWWTEVAPAPAAAAATAAANGTANTGSKKAAAKTQRWNLWAGLNGQRFTEWELLQPLPEVAPGAAAAATATVTAAAAGLGCAPATARRLVNRLEEHRLICTKSGLAGVLASIQAVAATTAAAASTALATSAVASPTAPSRMDVSWIPETYVVPAGPKAAAAAAAATHGSLSRFRAAFAAHAAAGRRIWIAKPTCLNRGNGIQVFDSLEKIMEHLQSRPAGSSLILQKYIERPLLLGGRKFDIRAYVLVGPDGRIWFHKEAYCRTSSTPYDGSDLTNRSAHLTNDAVQKHLESYNAYEDHCKLSLEELGPALLASASAAAPAVAASASSSSTKPSGETSSSQQRVKPPSQPPPGTSPSPSSNPDQDDNAPLPPPSAAPPTPPSSRPLPHLDTRPGSESGLWGAMRRCVAALFSVAGAHRLNPRRLGHCFELLGLDFMLDEGGQLYLIEVNTSPALFRAGSYLSDLLPRLVEEVVQKAVDPLFPPPGGDRLSPAASTATTTSATDAAVTSTTAWAAAAALPKPLDGFVLVEMDDRLAAAAAACTAAGGGGATRSGSRRSTARISVGAGVGAGTRAGTGTGVGLVGAAPASRGMADRNLAGRVMAPAPFSSSQITSSSPPSPLFPPVRGRRSSGLSGSVRQQAVGTASLRKTYGMMDGGHGGNRNNGGKTAELGKIGGLSVVRAASKTGR